MNFLSLQYNDLEKNKIFKLNIAIQDNWEDVKYELEKIAYQIKKDLSMQNWDRIKEIEILEKLYNKGKK